MERRFDIFSFVLLSLLSSKVHIVKIIESNINRISYQWPRFVFHIHMNQIWLHYDIWFLTNLSCLAMNNWWYSWKKSDARSQIATKAQILLEVSFRELVPILTSLLISTMEETNILINYVVMIWWSVAFKMSFLRTANSQNRTSCCSWTFY